MHNTNKIQDAYFIIVRPYGDDDIFTVEFSQRGMQQKRGYNAPAPSVPPPEYSALVTKRNDKYEVEWRTTTPSSNPLGSLEDFMEAAKQAVSDHLSRENP
jgi:hypothetical protein